MVPIVDDHVSARGQTWDDIRRSLSETGISHLSGVASPEVLSAANRRLESLDDAPRVPDGFQASYEGPVGSADRRLRKIRRLAWADPNFWVPWIRETTAPRCAAALIGGRAALILMAAFLKPRRVGSAIRLHQDQALWDDDLPGAISIWLPLGRANSANGGLVGYPGSHTLGPLAHDGGAVGPELLSLERRSFPVVIPGNGLVWDRYFVHGSGRNNSGMDRKAIVMVFADARLGSPTRERIPVSDILRGDPV